jgi:hypothetical protein
MKALILATLLVASCSPVSSEPGTPTATAARATPSPTATVAPGLTRYVNAELGYSVDLPAGWRRATCSRGVVTTSPLEASETFVGVPDTEEIIQGGVRTVDVRVTPSDGLTPAAWLERNASQPDIRFEPATLRGRTGARGFIGATGATYAFAFAARGWMYIIEMPYFGRVDQELEAILATLRILDDATVGRVPAATPTPRTIEAVVDLVADGFARKDVTAIAEAMAPCIIVGAIPGHPDIRSRAAYLTPLAVEFGTGTSIQVRPRPIESEPGFGNFVRSTRSSPGEPDQRIDLMLGANGDRWSVVGVLIRTTAN